MNKLTEINPTHYDDINFFDFCELLWDGKWKIIATSFVAAVIGVGFSILEPKFFEVSTPIQSSNQSVFLKYTSLNDLLKNEGFLYQDETNPDGYIFNSDTVFRIFAIEFNDYEEMVDAVGKSEFVQQSIIDLDDDDKQIALINFAKNFKIKPSSPNWTMSFVWHDVNEGQRLFNDAVRQTLLNVKSTSLENINYLAESIDIQNTLRLEKLRNKLSLIEQFQIDRDKIHIRYLSEQSAIARELGIEMNQLDMNALLQSSNEAKLGVNSNSQPFYLRGYKAIEKEITIIQNRSYEEKMLTSDDYMQTKEEIISLEKDLSSSQLRKVSEAIAKDNPNDWIKFNFAFSDVKSHNNSKMYFALSVISGGMVGVMYVLFSYAIRKRKQNLAKA